MRKPLGEIFWRRSLLAATYCFAFFLSATSYSIHAFAEGAEAFEYLKDASAFTAYAAELVGRALPPAKAKIIGSLTLSISDLPGGRSAQMNLESIYSYCLRDPDACQARLAAHIAQITKALGDIAPVKREDLRAIVRTSAYVESAQRMYKGQGDPVAEPLVGDLWVLCAVDLPGAIQTLGPAQRSALNLSQDEALALCKQNIAAALPPLTPYRRDFPWAGVNVVTGDPYDSSWLIFPERWAALAESLQGDLLVAAPGVNVLIYGSGRETGSAAVLAKAAAVVTARAQKPLSTAVFRWTPTGWEEAKP
jgi:hypothetical protein